MTRPALTPFALLPLAALKCVDDDSWIRDSIQEIMAQEASRFYAPDFMRAPPAPPTPSGPQPQAPPSPAAQQQPSGDGVRVMDQTLADRRAAIKASRPSLSTDLPAAKAARTQPSAVTLSTELSDSQAGACVVL